MGRRGDSEGLVLLVLEVEGAVWPWGEASRFVGLVGLVAGLGDTAGAGEGEDSPSVENMVCVVQPTALKICD